MAKIGEMCSEWNATIKDFMGRKTWAFGARASANMFVICLFVCLSVDMNAIFGVCVCVCVVSRYVC